MGDAHLNGENDLQEKSLKNHWEADRDGEWRKWFRQEMDSEQQRVVEEDYIGPDKCGANFYSVVGAQIRRPIFLVPRGQSMTDQPRPAQYSP